MPGTIDTAARLHALPLPVADVGSTNATAANLTLGVSTYGKIGANGDLDWYAINLVAGQTYDFRLEGVGRTPVPDTFLRLRDAQGKIVGFNDDVSFDTFGSNSVLKFTAQASGVFYVEASGFQSNVGDFLLTAVKNNPAGRVFTADEVAWQLTNNFERFFQTTEGANIPASAFDLSGGREVTYNATRLTAAGRALAERALDMWSDITGIDFVATNGAAQVVMDDNETDVSAFAENVTTSDGTIKSSNLQISTGWLGEFGTTLDSYSFETYMHEIGHVLGLGHGGNYDGDAVYGEDNYYLNDSIHLSIMSYMQAANDEFTHNGGGFNTFSNAQFRWVLTPMIADILAMKNVYGLSTTTRLGNTTYGYHSNTGNVVLDQAVTLNDPANDNYVAFTVFDNGGIDTIDMSGFNGAQRINLNQGASSNVLGGRLNMGIAYGTVVERAIGGGGADALTGNSSNNRLTGNGGADTLTGGGGADTLIGGLGSDVYIVDALDTISEALNGGNDLVQSSASITLAVNLENLFLRDFTAARIGNGNEIANRIEGNSFANRLSGRVGSDTLLGGGGSDTLIGGSGNDTVTGGLNQDIFVFNVATIAANVDRITDFNAANEKIYLEDAIFSALSVGALGTNAFAKNLTGRATDASDRIIYNSATGDLFYDADGVNGAAGMRFAVLAANLSLTEANFVVF